MRQENKRCGDEVTCVDFIAQAAGHGNSRGTFICEHRSELVDGFERHGPRELAGAEKLETFGELAGFNCLKQSKNIESVFVPQSITLAESFKNLVTFGNEECSGAGNSSCNSLIR